MYLALRYRRIYLRQVARLSPMSPSFSHKAYLIGKITILHMTDIVKVTKVDDHQLTVELPERYYKSLMPAIRKELIRAGYEYYNVECIDENPETYRYRYLKVR